jgi:hypothetical protein
MRTTVARKIEEEQRKNGRWFISCQKERKKERKKEKHSLFLYSLRFINNPPSSIAHTHTLGLVIVLAFYGSANEISNFVSQSSDSPKDSVRRTASLPPFVCDVTIPLQQMVEESKLTLHAGGKQHLEGFFDPCPEEEEEQRALLVRYLFHDRLHQVIIADTEPLVLPSYMHRLA